MKRQHVTTGRRTLLRQLLCLILTTALSMLALGAASTSGKVASAANNVVYVNSNNPNPGQNSILAYRRDPATGCLTLLGSFATGGTGTANPTDALGPDDHDQEIIISPDRRFLFTVNSGSNTVAVFSINADGSLTLVKGSPFPSGGINPVSLGLSGHTLYVVNQNGDPAQLPNDSLPNYTAFRVAANGRLVHLPNSTVEFGADSFPTQALVAPDGSALFGIELFANPYSPQLAPFLPPRGSLLDSFGILPNGRLKRAPGSPQPPPESALIFPGAPPAARYVLGLQAHPTERIVYAGFVLGNRLGVYTYDESGALTFVSDAANSGGAICWIAISPDGTRLYTSNSATNSISVYDISDPLAPVEIQHVPLRIIGDPPPVPPGPTLFATTPFQLAVDPRGRFVYVINHEVAPANDYPEGNALHILQVQPDGTLAESACSPEVLPQTFVPASAHPFGVAVL
jgi:6-phosphogluconolactonase (cycloisomerase 2 family)